jgi:UPF0288 family protein (methanogenesis marker protein 3)
VLELLYYQPNMESRPRGVLTDMEKTVANRHFYTTRHDIISSPSKHVLCSVNTSSLLAECRDSHASVTVSTTEEHFENVSHYQRNLHRFVTQNIESRRTGQDQSRLFSMSSKGSLTPAAIIHLSSPRNRFIFRHRYHNLALMITTAVLLAH